MLGVWARLRSARSGELARRRTPFTRPALPPKRRVVMNVRDRRRQRSTIRTGPARAVRVDGSRARQAVAVRVQAPRAPGRSARVLCIVLGAPRRLGGRDVVLDARRAHLEAANAAGVRAHLGLAVVARAVLLAPCWGRASSSARCAEGMGEAGKRTRRLEISF